MIRGRGKPLLLVAPVGVIDDFSRDDGWVGDRPASGVNNLWESNSAEAPGNNIPMVIKSNKIQPVDGYISPYQAFVYMNIDSADHEVYIDITNSSSAGGDQLYWIFQLCATLAADLKNVQLQVSQRNSYVVWYPPGAGFPNIYASGIGMAYGVTERWYFKVTHGVSNVSFVVRKSALDGTGMTTIMTGNTGSDNPTGNYILLVLHVGQSIQKVGRLS